MAKKILVVDDEKRIVDLLYQFLSKAGFEVLTAGDGESALKIAKEAVPDLIVLDVIMPGMDGGEVMAHIREDEQLRKIPVIFLTGAISEEESRIYDEARTGHMYLSKVSDIREQIRAIKHVLGP